MLQWVDTLVQWASHLALIHHRGYVSFDFNIGGGGMADRRLSMRKIKIGFKNSSWPLDMGKYYSNLGKSLISLLSAVGRSAGLYILFNLDGFSYSVLDKISLIFLSESFSDQITRAMRWCNLFYSQFFKFFNAR